MRIEGLGAVPLYGPISGTPKTSGSSEFNRILNQVMQAEKTAVEKPAGIDSLVSSILEKGLYETASERRLERLRQEIRQQVMAEWGVSEESLAKLETSAREDLLQRIEDEVARRLEERLRKEREAAAHWGLRSRGGPCCSGI